MTFFAVLLQFYDLKYLNLTKSRLSNKKSGMVLQVTLILNSKINIDTKFESLSLKMTKLDVGLL